MLRPQRSMEAREGSSLRNSSSFRTGINNDGGGDELVQMRALASSLSNASSAGGVDPRLIDDLHDFLPLVQSFLDQDRKATSSFTRKAKMTYTKTPSKDLISKKATDQKGRNVSQSIPTKKQSVLGDKDRSVSCTKIRDGRVESSSAIARRALEAEKEKEGINALTEQLEDLRKQLSEKEELLKAAEIAKNQLTSAQTELNELECQIGDKESLLKACERQLSDVKVKLAERQSVLEKVQWEAMTSINQVKKLQEDLKTSELEMSAVKVLVDGLMKDDDDDDDDAYPEDYDITPHQPNHVNEIDDLNELDMQKMEEARKAYVAAVAAAKELQDEESVAAAATARLYLQLFVLAA